VAGCSLSFSGIFIRYYRAQIAAAAPWRHYAARLDPVWRTGMPFKVKNVYGLSEAEKEALIWAANTARRTFTPDQRAMLIVKTYHDPYKEETKEAHLAGTSKGGSSKGVNSLAVSPKTSNSAPKSKRLVHRFREERQLSEYRAKIAIKLYNEARDLEEEVIQGLSKLAEAEKMLAKRKEKKPKQRKRVGSNSAVEVEMNVLDPDEIARADAFEEEVMVPFVEEFRGRAAQREVWERLGEKYFEHNEEMGGEAEAEDGEV
jgi:hypothetical protein